MNEKGGGFLLKQSLATEFCIHIHGNNHAKTQNITVTTWNYRFSEYMCHFHKSDSDYCLFSIFRYPGDVPLGRCILQTERMCLSGGAFILSSIHENIQT